MRDRNPATLFLSLLLCACGGDGANQADPRATDANATAAAPAGAPTGPTDGNRQVQRQGGAAQTPQPSAELTLAAAPAQVSAGSTVTLTLGNESQQQIGYNLCTSGLETSAGRSIPTSRVCTMELRTLDSRRTATYRYKLPVNMLDGRYRFVTQVEWMGSGGRSAVRSNSFEVRSS